MPDPRDPRDPSDPTTPPGTPPPPASPVPATPILIERHRLGLGMLRSQVEMDPSHSLTRILSAAPRPKKRTRRIPWVGDQGSTEHCVGYSWYGFLRASPHGITFKGGPDAIYTGAQDYDEFPGKEPEMYGSSVRGGARFLLADPRTDLARYHWAHSVDQVLDWIGSDKGSPVILGTDWTRCLVPGTRVLTTDLRWVPAEKLEIGDKLIGFDEEARRDSKYRTASVLSNHTILQDAYEVKTSRGTITVSGRHLFVKCDPSLGRSWVKAHELKPGDTLAYSGPPWEVDTSWEAGWLAGFYDGEGCLAAWEQGKPNSALLSCSQVVGPTLEKALTLLRARGFDYGVKDLPAGVGRDGHTRQHQQHWYLRGENAKLRFLGSIRPQRLLAKAHRAWEGHATWNKGTVNAVVQEVRKIGREPVIALGTSTHTLITEGFLSHNSMFRPDSSGLVKVEGPIIGGHAWLLVGYDDKKKLALGQSSWGRGWGRNGRFWLTYSDLDKLLRAQGEACVATRA